MLWKKYIKITCIICFWCAAPKHNLWEDLLLLCSFLHEHFKISLIYVILTVNTIIKENCEVLQSGNVIFWNIIWGVVGGIWDQQALEVHTCKWNHPLKSLGPEKSNALPVFCEFTHSIHFHNQGQEDSSRPLYGSLCHRQTFPSMATMAVHHYIITWIVYDVVHGAIVIFDRQTSGIEKCPPQPPGGIFAMAPFLKMFRTPSYTSVPSFMLL